MSRIVIWCAGLALAGALAGGGLAGGGQPAAAVQVTGSPGRAVGVPGLGALNEGGHAEVFQVSCGSAGNCAAGGIYHDRRGHGQGFVVSERNGRWGRATGVPGLGALRKGKAVLSVSCGSAGNCAAGGYFGADGTGHQQGFVAVERNGVWGRAIEVPGLGTLNAGGLAQVVSVSCGSAGNCAAGGFYHDSHHFGQGFVVSERNGRWGQAIEVPGLGALNVLGASVGSVSCGSAGNCAAGGHYTSGADSDGNAQALGFLAVEQNGVWGQAIGVPGLGGPDTLTSIVDSVSCVSAGDCAAVGDYTGHRAEGFVVSEQNGVWGQAIDVPGLATLAGPHFVDVSSVSCASAGNCAAGGGYQAGHAGDRGFVAVEQNGVWGQAIDVPGLATLGKFASVSSVSCASAGDCAAGGAYRDQHQHWQGYLVREKNGVWSLAMEVPGLGGLNKGGNAGVNSVSCGSPVSCAAAGSYTDRNRFHRFQGFVTLTA